MSNIFNVLLTDLEAATNLGRFVQKAIFFKKKTTTFQEQHCKKNLSGTNIFCLKQFMSKIVKYST